MLQCALEYLAQRRTWIVAGGLQQNPPSLLIPVEDELREPRQDWFAYRNWRSAIRVAIHLAGIGRQPTLLLSQYSPNAAAMGLLAEVSGIPHFRLVRGLICTEELAIARLAAEVLMELPIHFVQAGAGTGWDCCERSIFNFIVLDHTMPTQQGRELARNPAQLCPTIYSPIRN